MNVSSRIKFETKDFSNFAICSCLHTWKDIFSINVNFPWIMILNILSCDSLWDTIPFILKLNISSDTRNKSSYLFTYVTQNFQMKRRKNSTVILSYIYPDFCEWLCRYLSCDHLLTQDLNNYHVKYGAIFDLVDVIRLLYTFTSLLWFYFYSIFHRDADSDSKIKKSGILYE